MRALDIFKILSFALVALILILIVDKNNKEISILLSLLSTVGIFLFIFPSIKEIVGVLNNLIDGAGINKTNLVVILKVTGIAYLVEMVKNVCNDAGNTSLGTKVEMAGKVSVAVLTLPIITSVINLVEGLI